MTAFPLGSGARRALTFGMPAPERLRRPAPVLLPPPATHLLVALGIALWSWAWTVHLLAETDFLSRHVIPAGAWKAAFLGLADSPMLQTYGALSWDGLLEGRLWQPITHLFLHDGLLPAAFDLGLLLIAGRMLEPIVGRRHLALLFLGAGGSGAMLHLAAHPHVPLFGSAAAVAGVLFAACVVWADFDLRAFRGLAWLPMPFRARHLSAGVVLMLIGGFLLENGAAVSDRVLRTDSLAILLGGLSGIAYVRALGFGRRTMVRERVAPALPPPAPPPAIELESEETDDPQVFIREEVDPILDKIRARGMDSLTPEERRRLSRASELLSR